MSDNLKELNIIRPSKGITSLRLAELWHYRELLYFLIWRDIKVRYKQTMLGILWVIIQPLCAMLLFSVFFGRLAKIPSDGIPYPAFVYAALLLWNYFSQAVNQTANCLVMSPNLIQKVYFPRLVMPLASTLSGLVDFFIAFPLLLVLMLYYGIEPSAAMLKIPFLVSLAVMTALGAGLWLSAFNVRYRDVRHAMPFLMQVWMFATPVVYSSNLLSGSWKDWYGLNPMAGAIAGFRACIFGMPFPDKLVFVSLMSAIVLFISGIFYFRATEKDFADIV